MGRIRTVKPEFFLHHELYLLEVQVGLPIRLSFAGLWTQSDREGRFTWKPEMLKTQIIPYDNADFGAILDALASKGFIEKYSVEGKDYGLIPSWNDHQIINNREGKSRIPTRGEVVVTREGNYQDAALGEGKGKEGNGKEDASVAARVLSERIGNLDFRFQEQLARMLGIYRLPGETLEACVDRMVGQWELYNASRPKLNYPVGSSRKFFESGVWHDKNLWPWREGQAPIIRGPSAENKALQAIKEREEAVRRERGL